ncbi:hypothetical protein [Acaryochloris marina]|uniref:Uncharacterized protein n=1 Tax=Acaryochloris marina (strain MBIC 11017) TaxID=329726 RepID=B0CEM8_ACAM1|nr:hypothetical protein [Acaryochloris marina]ABW28133.1 hypothetical protein AM1_3137 [Acaryochloris marina MBIC11017]BDM77170.1 hypothetical protein AM10699_00440 [Acaryochloris marina MBIC10699]
MKWVRAIGGIAVAVGLVVGWKFYNRFSMAANVRQIFLAACAEESQCTGAVDQHFQSCFDANYHWGGRRQAGHLNGNKFTDCLREKAGAPVLPDPSK